MTVIDAALDQSGNGAKEIFLELKHVDNVFYNWIVSLPIYNILNQPRQF